MNSTIKRSIGIIVFMSVLVCGTANAKRIYQHRNYNRGYSHNMITVIAKPTTTFHVINRLSQKERLQIALVYLAKNKNLSIKQYAKMTGLSKTMAEAELSTFAADKDNPIILATKGKKKLFYKE